MCQMVPGAAKWCYCFVFAEACRQDKVITLAFPEAGPKRFKSDYGNRMSRESSRE